jgi:hypothetical protein
MGALAACARIKLRADAHARLHAQAAGYARLAKDAVAAAVPAFGESASPQMLADFEQHAGEHLAELGRLLEGGQVQGFEFVRTWARECATERFPIEATLQAYRCLTPLWSRWLDDMLTKGGAGRRDTALAGLVTQYASAVSIAYAAAYAAHATVFAEAEADRRAELLGLLVGGFDPADARTARLLKHAGYLQQRLRFCVAVAQATDPLEMENTARVQRIADSLIACVAPLSVRVLVGVRSKLVTAVFSDIRRVSGWTAPQASVAERVRERLLDLGPSVLAGLSGEQVSLSQIPRGLHEATVALDFASVSARVIAFNAISIRRLLIHRGVEYAQTALPPWFGALREADAKARGELARTLRAFADADLNVQAAARDLQVHANTVYARLQRVEDLTGLNPRRFHDLTDLLLAADCARL